MQVGVALRVPQSDQEEPHLNMDTLNSQLLSTSAPQPTRPSSFTHVAVCLKHRISVWLRGLEARSCDRMAFASSSGRICIRGDYIELGDMPHSICINCAGLLVLTLRDGGLVATHCTIPLVCMIDHAADDSCSM
jgi:hypothetical protein